MAQAAWQPGTHPGGRPAERGPQVVTTWRNRPFNPDAVDRIVAVLAALSHTLARIIEYIHRFR